MISEMINYSSLALPAALALVPVVGAVYQVYFKEPKKIHSDVAIANLVHILSQVPPVLLPIGTHDITPKDARYNYVIDVHGPTAQDATGTLQVTQPNGGDFAFVRYGDECGSYVTSKCAEINNGSCLLIAEPTNDQSELAVFGAVVHD